MNGTNYKMNQKTIIIKSNNFIFFHGLNNIYAYYFSYGLFFRAVRKVLKKIKLCYFYTFFYGKWKRQLKITELVILFDNGIENVDWISRYIKRVNPKIRIVFWYWNPVKFGDVALNDKNIDEVWTYSRFDAKKYNLKYNPQFYRQVFTQNERPLNIDMLFLGKNKGREQILADLKKVADAQELKYKFIIVDSKEKQVSYKEYLRYISSSRCIVDLVPNQSCGLTLRPLEALFYKKKLITNYRDIVNYDFYNKENIFVIGKDDINKLAEFVNSPYKKIDRKIVDYYNYESWLRRIERGESVEP